MFIEKQKEIILKLYKLLPGLLNANNPANFVKCLLKRK